MAVPGRGIGAAASGAVDPRRLAALRQALRSNSAAMALGDDIPRPNPASAMPDRPMPPVARPVEAPAPVVDPAVVAPVAAAPAPQRPVAIEQRGKQYFVIGEDGQAIGLAKPKRGGLYEMEDGRVLQLGDDGQSVTVVREAAPGDLTETAAQATDNLAASDTQISPPSAGNLRPNAVREDKVAALAQRVWQATGPDGEALSPNTLRQLRRQVDALSPDERAVFEASMSRDPDAVRERMARFDSLVADAARDPNYGAAKAIDEAGQARAAANTPRPANPEATLAPPDVAAARALVAESLPEGDWGALATAYNSLDPETLAEVQARTRSAWEPFLPSRAGVPNELTPNQLALLLRPAGPLDEMLLRMDAAKRAGDAEGFEAIKSEVQGMLASGSVSRDDYSDAVRTFTARRNLESSLRNAIIGTDELYAGEQARLLAGSVPPAQPSVLPGGSRSPEFATELPEGDMPPAGPSAREAAAAEADRIDRQAPLRGMSLEARKKLVGLADDADAGQLPLFLRGIDRASTPMESRRAGARSLMPGETKLDGRIDKARDLEDAVTAAHRELDAARASGDQESVIRAATKVVNAYEALDKAYPPRIVNERTGRWAEPTKKFMEQLRSGEAELPDGFSLEYGVRPVSDSRLNRGAMQETYDELIMTMAGMRPKADTNIARGNAAMDAGDLSRLAADAEGSFGPLDETLDFDPEFDAWTVERADLKNAAEPKRGSLGRSGPPPSRLAGALKTMFGEYDPLQLPFRERLARDTMTPQEWAEELLSRNTVFKPGTASYEMARDRIAKAIERQYGGPGKKMTLAENAAGDIEVVPETITPSTEPAAPVSTSQDPAQVPQQQGSWPQGRMNQRASTGPAPRENTAGSVDPGPARRDFSEPATPLSPEDEALLASNMELDAVDPELTPEMVEQLTSPEFIQSVLRAYYDAETDGGKNAAMSFDDWVASIPMSRRAEMQRAGKPAPASGSKPAGGGASATGTKPRKTRGDLEAEAEALFQEELRRGMDEGMSVEEARDAANRRRLEYVTQAKADFDIDESVTEAAGAASGTGGRRRRRGGKGSKGSKDGSEAPESDGAGKPPESDAASADGTKPPEGPPSDPPKDGTSPTPAQPEPPKKTRWSGRALLGLGAAVGIGTISALNRSGGGSSGRLDMGGGPGGDIIGPYIPVGAGDGVAPGMSEADRASQLLDRLRGKSGRGGSGPGYQTVQNYNVWG